MLPSGTLFTVEQIALPHVEANSRGAARREVTSVARACDILASFRQPGENLRLVDLALRTGLNKVTVFRLAETLARKGLIERVGARGYKSCVQSIQSSSFRIGYAAQSRIAPFIGTVTESLQVAATNARVDLLVLNNEESRKRAFRNADLFIREKVDLVIQYQLNADIATELARQVANAGIPMVAVDVPHPGAYYFGADNYKAGHLGGVQLGRWAAKNWRGEVDGVLLLGASAGGPVLEARLMGFWDGIVASLPHVGTKSPIRYDTKASFVGALDVVRKHVRRSRPGNLLVAAVNDPAALGALQAFREYGLDQNCAVVGQGAVAEARYEMRREGTRLVGSVAYFPEEYGEKLIRLAFEILNKRPVPSALFTRHEIVTPDNVNKLYANDLLMDLQPLRACSAS
jgi:ribose transport system substrate-binding protein